MKRLILVLAAVAIQSLFAGKTCTWTGAKNNKWIDPGNWRDGEVPGVLWNGTGTPAAACGDTAVFGASPVTAIDCTGLFSVGTVWIQGADAAAYVFGDAADADNRLGIESTGAVIVDADVPEPPRMAVASLANRSYADGYFSLTNEAAKAVVFTGLDNSRLRPGTTGAGQQNYTLVGKCEFTGTFETQAGSYIRFLLYRPGPFVFDCDVSKVVTIQPDETCELEITKGHVFAFDPSLVNPGVSISYLHGVITFSGEGLLQLAEHHTGYSWQNQSYITLNGGTGITIKCPVTCVSEVAGYETPSIHLWTSAGVFTMDSPANTMPGSIDMAMTWAGLVTFPSVARLGTLSGFSFGSGKDGAVVETTCASDETFAQSLVYTNSYQYTVRNAGAGTLTVASEISGSVTGGVATAAFEAKNGPIVFSPTFSASGAPGAVRFAGTKGVSVPASVAFPEGTEVQLTGGQNLSVTGSGAVSWSAFKNVSGKNTLALPSGASLTLGALAMAGGSLDIVTGDPSAHVVVSGMTSASPVPTGLTQNGQPVAFADDGRLMQNPTAVDLTISAKGDQVPNEPTQKVGIVSEGSGANTVLIADETAVKALVHKAANVSATIDVADGQTLTAEEVAVDYDGGDLTIGETVGTGTLAATTLRNDSPVSELTVNAALGTGSFTASGIGAKTVRTVGAKTVGTLTLSGGRTTLSGGRWEMQDGAFVNLSDGAELDLGASLVSTDWFSGTNGFGRVQVKKEGVIRLPAGGVLTNRIELVAGTTGAVYLEGGTFCGSSPQSYKTGSENPFFPGYCHTYYGVSSGTWTFRKNTSLGSGTHYGVITQRGGTVVDEGGGGSFRFGMGNTQMTDWYLCGGTFKGRGLNIGDWGGYNNYTAALTVDGAAVFTAGGTAQMAYWNSTSTRSNVRSILNLNGGVFVGSVVNRNWGSYSAAGRANDRAYVNFNGGTFRSTGNGYMFGSDGDGQLSHVDRVTVFAKGARFDTNGKAPEIATPLEAPAGQGVESVAWNDELTGMIAAPIVKIVGSGEGARAHALLDETTGKVTNIVVTCRGWNYEDDTYAEVCYGYYDGTTVRVPVTLTPNVSGGISVFGGGTLQLSRTNTYAGATCVSNATLALNCPDAVNPASRLLLEQDGVLDLRNNAQTFADIETRGGTVKNGLPLASGLVIDFDAARAGVVRMIDVSKFAYAPGAAVSLENFDATKLEEGCKYRLATFTDAVSLDLTVASALIPEGWKLRLGTRSLRLVPESGLLLLVR